MPVVIPTGAGNGNHATDTAFRRLKTHADALESKLNAMQAFLDGQPAPLTLEQIQTALQAGGSNPLNLQNLQGTPAVTNPNIPTSTTPPGGGTAPPTPVPPTQPAYGSACNARSNHLDVITQVKADLVAMGADLSGPCGAFQIVSLAVQRLQAMGEAAGTLKKTSGNNCNGHAVDIVCYATGAIWDVLSDAGATNGPQWNFDGFVDVANYEGPACP